jgi:hypothetical protein
LIYLDIIDIEILFFWYPLVSSDVRAVITCGQRDGSRKLSPDEVWFHGSWEKLPGSKLSCLAYTTSPTNNPENLQLFREK